MFCFANCECKSGRVHDQLTPGTHNRVSTLILNLFNISNFIFDLRVKPWSKTHPNPQHFTQTGQCHIPANIQSHAVVKASHAIACIDLYNGGLVLAIVVIISNPVTTWSQTYIITQQILFKLAITALNDPFLSWQPLGSGSRNNLIWKIFCH